MENSIFIRALVYAGEHPNGFTYAELQEYLGTTEFGILADELNGHGSNSAFNSISKAGETKFWLTKSGHELLYEIQQVQNANKEAIRASKLAFISIAIAALIPLATFFLDRALPQDNVLNEDQFERVLKLLDEGDATGTGSSTTHQTETSDS